MGTHTQKEVVPEEENKLQQKTVSDIKQDEKHVPDLLESIIRPTDPGKEELLRKTMKMSQFRYKIMKIRVSTYWMSGN